MIKRQNRAFHVASGDFEELMSLSRDIFSNSHLWISSAVFRDIDHGFFHADIALTTHTQYIVSHALSLT